MIFDIESERIDSTQQTEVGEEWDRQKVELFNGSEYDPVRIRGAAKIIEDLIISKEKQGVKVSAYVEQQK